MSSRLRYFIACVALALGVPATGTRAESSCGPDGLQQSGSIYRICMPAPDHYNGRLVIWAHGFQDANEPVSIPQDQLCFDDGTCLNDMLNALGFGFATNSYAKTGLAIVQGEADILDLMDVYAQQEGAPERVYVLGASEGGIITTLLTEAHPDVIDGAVAACGPIGDFHRQLAYFGSARLVFETLWPGLIPGGPFAEPAWVVDDWSTYFEQVVQPALEASPARLLAWITAARLPFDPNDYANTSINSAAAVLRYAVVDAQEAMQTLGGFPFDNQGVVYPGDAFGPYINAHVQRVSADPAAVAEIDANYQTSGVLDVPLVTMHTTLDEQVPYFHEPLSRTKASASGSFPGQLLPLTYARYGHCNFGAAESLVAFLVMLRRAGDPVQVQGLAEVLSGDELARFQELADQSGIGYRVDGEPGVVPDP